MTDKQMEFIANLIADKFESCDTMEEVKEAVREIREMSMKGSKDEKDTGK